MNAKHRPTLGRSTRALLAALLALLALAAAGCGRERPSDEAVPGTTGGETGAFGERLSGRVLADGSSTVAPFVTRGAEDFRQEQPGVRVTIGVSGTGGGFERFCRGETDIATASRAIAAEERRLCTRKGVEFLELPVANDALSLIVNRENDWADCLTVEQLKTIWEPGSKIRNWNQVDEAFPDERLTLFGPGTDSGTFDYFTGAIVGEEGASRSDYSATENDNVIVRGVAGEKGGLGYIGLSYVEENEGTLKPVEIDGGDGCVAPSPETVQNGWYKPLARPLFVYVKLRSLERVEVEAFVDFLLANERRLAERALFVPLTDEQLQRTRDRFERALSRIG